MNLLESFLSASHTSLKICGVRTPEDAARLVEVGVEALGVNFWPGSKRYLAPEHAGWLAGFAGRILRVGVFVNCRPAESIALYRKGWIDVVQLHGDELPEDVQPYVEEQVPFIKAVGVRCAEDADRAARYGADAVLLDTHAPGTYGGTGACFDWDAALAFRASHPGTPLLLAGGIEPRNAREACCRVRPVAIDVASGAESAPGVKDPLKVRALVDAVLQANQAAGMKSPRSSS